MKYERLTEYQYQCNECEKRICQYNQPCAEENICKVYNRLAELEDKIERGELVDVKENHIIPISRASGKSSKQLETIEILTKYENGTLLELPCKVGGRVYKIMKVAGVERISEYVVTDFSYGIHGNFIKAHSLKGNAKIITFRDFCDCWFSTKAEAEQKLKEKQNETK